MGVITREPRVVSKERIAEILDQKCAMCEHPFQYLAQVMEGRHWNENGYTGQVILLHKHCYAAFRTDDGVSASYDPDAYTISFVVSEEAARIETLQPPIDWQWIVQQIVFSVQDYDPEQVGTGVWLQDIHGRIWIGIYDGFQCLFEPLSRESDNPLHRRLWVDFACR